MLRSQQRLPILFALVLMSASCGGEEASSPGAGGASAGTGATSGAGGAGGDGATSGSGGVGASSSGSGGAGAGSCASKPPARPKPGDFYVSPSGTPDGDGSEAHPWDLATALAQPDAVTPGSTVWLHGGTYPGSFTSTLTGTADAPIVVRQYPGERATLDGGDTTVLTVAGGGYAWFWGFEVTRSDPTTPKDIQGISLGAPAVKLIDVVTHDHGGNGIGDWSEAPDAEVYGCLSYFNGRHEEDSNHAYGIYAQNQTGQKWITDNVFIHNFGNYALHLYGSDQAYLDHFRVIGNATIGGSLLLGGGRVATDAVIKDNYLYGGTFDDQILNVGYLPYGEGLTSSTVEDNYVMVGRALFNSLNVAVTMTGNTFYGRTEGFDAASFPDDTYFTAPWPDDPPKPSGVHVFVRPNDYEPGRANVVVYDWEGAASAKVDLAGVLAEGDAYVIHDAQDYWGDAVASGVYSGAPVDVPLTGTAIATPRSVPSDREPPVHTGSDFNVFVVERQCPPAGP